MYSWWTSSPYFEAGIYLPGSPSGPSNPGLTSAWLAIVQGYGWGFIPIWSGLQAPCACSHPTKTNPSKTFPTCNQFAHKFSENPTQAQSDGSAQATAAFQAAQTLGLDGGIVYLDVENYDSNYVFPDTGTTCGTAVQQYVAGFTTQMHTLGGPGSAGIYGGIFDAPSDFLGADDVYISKSDGRVTVWGFDQGNASNFGDTLWNKNQRIHQYRIDVNETWNSNGLHVDDDLVDAKITPESKTKSYSFADPTAFGPGSAQVGGNANGINDGVTMHMGAVVGFDESSMDGFIDTFFQPSASSAGPTWPYPVGENLLPSPPAGLFGDSMTLTAINNKGQVVGSYYNANYPSDGVLHGFLYSPSTGKFRLLDIPNDSNLLASYPNSINDAGWVVGTYLDSIQEVPYYQQHCILWKPPYKSPVTFDSFGAVGDCSQWYGFGIQSIQPVVNGVGQFAGTALSGGSIDQWYGLTTGTIFVDDVGSNVPSAGDIPLTLMDPLEDTIFGAYGFNNNGQVSGLELIEEEGGMTSGIFVNTDESLLGLINPSDSCSFSSGINDDVQFVFPPCTGTQGYTMDSQH